MRKIKAIFCILIMTFGLMTTVYAADVLYRMLHADKVESFKAARMQLLLVIL